MKRALVVTAEAEAEIDQAEKWYQQRSPKAAAGFRLAVDAALQSIDRYPMQYQVVYRTTRRALLDDYPYAFFYLVTDGQVTVISCIHMSRDPALWR